MNSQVIVGFVANEKKYFNLYYSVLKIISVKYRILVTKCPQGLAYPRSENVRYDSIGQSSQEMKSGGYYAAIVKSSDTKETF